MENPDECARDKILKMENEPKAYYVRRIKEIGRIAGRLKKKLRWIAFLRLLVFLLLFPAIFILTPRLLAMGIVSTILLIVLFLWLIRYYLKLEHRSGHAQALLQLNQHESDALNYNYSFFDPGDEFLDTEHPYSFDMDLFGVGSVFQFINRTVSVRGKKMLATWMTNGTLLRETIADRQIAVKELALMPDLIQDFRAAGSLKRDTETDLSVLEDWIKEPFYYLGKKVYPFLAITLPVITILSIILAVFLPVFRGIAIACYLVQLFIVGSRFPHISKHHQVISKRHETLTKYQELFGVIEKGGYVSKILQAIHDTLVKDQQSAARSVHKLARIVSAFDNRLNVVAAIFLEGILLWDIQCMIRLERWKKAAGRGLNKWINALAEYDGLVSLATYSFNQPGFCYPSFSDTQVLKTESIGHLLIEPGERVCNDFEIDHEGSFVLVTGANMSGKSTFLRTIATNMILAMAGAPVCAREFAFRPISLFSSMRTSDSLNKHESYFYAELKRLKELLDRLRRGEKLFIILDEILKGTNSTDKQKGSRAALQQILALDGTGIIATHDLELASIEKDYPGKVRNVCFEIEIDKARISFDYTLREGITTRMNALLLMEQMGIIRT